MDLFYESVVVPISSRIEELEKRIAALEAQREQKGEKEPDNEELIQKVNERVEEYIGNNNLGVWKRAVVEIVPYKRRLVFWNLLRSMGTLCGAWDWPYEKLIKGEID